MKRKKRIEGKFKNKFQFFLLRNQQLIQTLVWFKLEKKVLKYREINQNRKKSNFVFHAILNLSAIKKSKSTNLSSTLLYDSLHFFVNQFDTSQRRLCQSSYLSFDKQLEWNFRHKQTWSWTLSIINIILIQFKIVLKWIKKLIKFILKILDVLNWPQD